MAGKKKNDGRKRIAIVGGIVSGKSFDGWFGRYTGSETVLSQIGDSGDIDIYVNSQGGSVFAGFEIVNALNAAVAQDRAVTFYVSAFKQRASPVYHKYVGRRRSSCRTTPS